METQYNLQLKETRTVLKVEPNRQCTWRYATAEMVKTLMNPKNFRRQCL